MRIHRLTLQDVRGLHHAEVELATDRVTVVEAPNETGKTTLFDALDVLLHERDRSGKKHVKALKPVDRDVPSLIEAELTLGPHRLTVRKRFNKQPITELVLATPTRRQLTGDAAHDELQRLLEQHTDLALLEALRFRQGRSLDALALGASSSLAAVLDAGAGGTGVGDEDALHDRVLDEAARYHTLKARTPTKLLTGSEEALASAAAEVERLRQVQAEVTDASARAAAVAVEQRDLRARREELAPELARRRDAARAVTDLRAKRAAAEAALRVATADRARAADAQASREELHRQVTEAQTALAGAEERRQAAEDALAPVQATLEDHDAALVRAEARMRRAHAALALVRLRTDLERAERDLARERTRRRRIEEAHEAAQEAAAALAGTRSSVPRHARVRAAADALRLAEVRLDAEAPTVTVTARQALTVSKGDDATPRDDATALAAGEQLELPVPDRVRLRLGEVADVEVVAGRSLEERQAALRTAREELTAACEDLGVDGPEAAEALADEVARHRGTVAERDAIVARELDGQDLDALEARIRDGAATVASLRRRLEERASLRRRLEERAADVVPSDGPTQPDPTQPDPTQPDPTQPDPTQPGSAQLDLDQPEPQDPEEREAAVAELEAELSGLRDRRATQAQVVTARHEELVNAQAEVAAMAAERDRLTAALSRARTQADDDTVAEHAARATALETDARAALHALDDRLASLDADAVELAVEVARAELDALERRRTELREEAAGLAGRLEVRGGDGVGEALLAAEAELERRRRDDDGLRRRAAAALALRDAFEAAREEAYTAYRAPLRERIVTAGRLVLGDDLDIELDEELRVITRTLQGSTLRFEQLSAGAREQLAILTALAAADLAGDGGVPLVLDDTLGYTDPGRLERLAALLGRTRGPQVVVLTCVGSRFAAIPGAQVVHLRDIPEAQQG